MSDILVKIQPPSPPVAPHQIENAHYASLIGGSTTRCKNYTTKIVSSTISLEKTKRGIYLDPKLSTISMFEMPEFEVRFRQCHFEWMTRASCQYSPTLVQEFYIVY